MGKYIPTFEELEDAPNFVGNTKSVLKMAGRRKGLADPRDHKTPRCFQKSWKAQRGSQYKGGAND